MGPIVKWWLGNWNTGMGKRMGGTDWHNGKKVGRNWGGTHGRKHIFICNPGCLPGFIEG